MRVKSGDRIDTGTGKERRRLTLEEAQAGGKPTPFTKDEWRDLRDASYAAMVAAWDR